VPAFLAQTVRETASPRPDGSGEEAAGISKTVGPVPRRTAPTPAAAEAAESAFGEGLALIQGARQRAARAANAKVIALYWRIGEYLHRASRPTAAPWAPWSSSPPTSRSASRASWFPAPRLNSEPGIRVHQAAAQSFVQCHGTAERTAPQIQLCLPGSIELALCIEQFETPLRSTTVAQVGQRRTAFCARHRARLGFELHSEGLEPRQTIGHFSEGCLDGLFVRHHRAGLAHLGQTQLGAQPAGREQRDGQLRRKAPRTLRAIEQAAHGRAGVAQGCRQREPREEGRPRSADVRVRRDERLLGLLDVRPLVQLRIVTASANEGAV